MLGLISYSEGAELGSFTSFANKDPSQSSFILGKMEYPLFA
jgi:hypothetical protein